MPENANTQNDRVKCWHKVVHTVYHALSLLYFLLTLFSDPRSTLKNLILFIYADYMYLLLSILSVTACFQFMSVFFFFFSCVVSLTNGAKIRLSTQNMDMFRHILFHLILKLYIVSK